MTKLNSLGYAVEIKDGRFTQSYPDGDLESYTITELDDLRFMEESWKVITKHEFKKIIRERHPWIGEYYD